MEKKLYYHLFIKKYLDDATIHFFTEEEAKECNEYLSLKSKSVIAPNGIDLSEFSEIPLKGRF
jgi:hypothetical protein